ncbi:hypothetical protein CVT26_011596 [Gymnopilus dilepis]|uniref:Uncharacterized protein n=1 Tax=Gymnopilus dilepis TaxID=231916 RepID=A0A409VXY2_9AGAR|nr:hypothetical protein CVT26_011596 [Gymnopilus dilepis]
MPRSLEEPYTPCNKARCRRASWAEDELELEKAFGIQADACFDVNKRTVSIEPGDGGLFEGIEAAEERSGYDDGRVVEDDGRSDVDGEDRSDIGAEDHRNVVTDAAFSTTRLGPFRRYPP